MISRLGVTNSGTGYFADVIGSCFLPQEVNFNQNKLWKEFLSGVVSDNSYYDDISNRISSISFDYTLPAYDYIIGIPNFTGGDDEFPYPGQVVGYAHPFVSRFLFSGGGSGWTNGDVIKFTLTGTGTTSIILESSGQRKRFNETIYTSPSYNITDADYIRMNIGRTRLYKNNFLYKNYNSIFSFYDENTNIFGGSKFGNNYFNSDTPNKFVEILLNSLTV